MSPARKMFPQTKRPYYKLLSMCGIMGGDFKNGVYRETLIFCFPLLPVQGLGGPRIPGAVGLGDMWPGNRPVPLSAGKSSDSNGDWCSTLTLLSKAHRSTGEPTATGMPCKPWARGQRLEDGASHQQDQ